MVAIRIEAATIKGVSEEMETAMMLDVGSSISLIQKDVLSHVREVMRVRPIPEMQLMTASGEQLPVQDFVCTQVQIDQLKVKDNFVVVNRLVTSVMLRVDFLQKNGLTLDSTTKLVTVHSSSRLNTALSKTHTLVLPAAFHPAQRRETQVIALAAEDEPSTDVVDDRVRSAQFW